MLSKLSNEYLSKLEAILETALVSFEMKKNKGLKTNDSVSLGQQKVEGI
jgi:hypothetical protein